MLECLPQDPCITRGNPSVYGKDVSYNVSITEKPWLILLKCSLSRGSSFSAVNTSKQSGDAKWFSEGMGACSEAQGQERLLPDMQTQSDQA